MKKLNQQPSPPRWSENHRLLQVLAIRRWEDIAASGNFFRVVAPRFIKKQTISNLFVSNLPQAEIEVIQEHEKFSTKLRDFCRTSLLYG